MINSRDVVAGTTRPGGHGQAEFKRLRRDYRRRIRPLTVPVLCAATVLSCIGATRTDPITTLACMFGGAFFATWFAFRDMFPEWIQRKADGAEGERRTARELARLGPEWTIWHDLNGPRGNLDHVVVGPAGVFLIDTKNWNNRRVTFDAGVPVSTRDEDGSTYRVDTLPGWIKAQSVRQSEAIGARLGGRGPWVQPVVALWADLEQSVTTTKGVTYVRGSDLASWLRLLPRKLDAGECAQITRALGTPSGRQAPAVSI